MAIEKLPAGSYAQWMSLRSRDVTASVAAALIGCHDFLSPYALWMIKAGRISGEFEETPPMRRGRLLEPVAVQLLREQCPRWKIFHNTGRRQLYYRDADRRIGATPDVIATDRSRRKILVQLKSVERGVFRSKWQVGEDGEVLPPVWICIQAVIEAVMVGADSAYVGALVIGHGADLHLAEVPINLKVFRRIEEATALFWESIAAGQPPDPDFTVDGEAIASVWSEDDGTEADYSNDERFCKLVEDRQTIKAHIKVSEAALEPIEAEIIDRIGRHERIYLPDWKVSRPIVTRRDKLFGTVSQKRQLVIRERTSP